MGSLAAERETRGDWDPDARQFQVQERAHSMAGLGFGGTVLTVSVEVKCGVKVAIEEV